MLQAIDIAPSGLRNRNRRDDLGRERERSRCWSNRAGDEADGSGGGLAVRALSANLEGVAAPLVLAQLAFELGLRVERH
jgi:hypothetical protein